MVGKLLSCCGRWNLADKACLKDSKARMLLSGLGGTLLESALKLKVTVRVTAKSRSSIRISLKIKLPEVTGFPSLGQELAIQLSGSLNVLTHLKQQRYLA
ncbi:hypothetical protein EBR78_11435 [bacterium]|nr:hypothetical protein [bacterium]